MNNSFASNLRELRISCKMNQRELAERIGTTQRTISYWENGQTQPDLSALVELAQVFDVSVDDLLGAK